MVEKLKKREYTSDDKLPCQGHALTNSSCKLEFNISSFVSFAVLCIPLKFSFAYSINDIVSYT